MSAASHQRKARFRYPFPAALALAVGLFPTAYLGLMLVYMRIDLMALDVPTEAQRELIFAKGGEFALLETLLVFPGNALLVAWLSTRRQWLPQSPWLLLVLQLVIAAASVGARLHLPTPRYDLVIPAIIAVPLILTFVVYGSTRLLSNITGQEGHLRGHGGVTEELEDVRQ